MTLKKLYVLAALAGLLVSDSVAAQQSSISDRMRHQTVRPVQKRQPASRLATFSGTSAKSDGTATNATVTITDNDTPTVTITATRNSLSDFCRAGGIARA